METVIGVGMWCEMGMRFISISIGTGISTRSATLDVHKVAVQSNSRTWNAAIDNRSAQRGTR